MNSTEKKQTIKKKIIIRENINLNCLHKNYKIFGKKLQHFYHDVFQSCYNLSQVSWLVKT